MGRKIGLKEAEAAAPSEVHALLLGMALNVVLAVLKFVTGTATHSAALLADGYKDLSEAVRTVLKLMLKHMRRDIREHKEQKAAGQRAERILSVVVLLFVACIGVRSVVGSVRDALEDHDTNYTMVLVIITAASVAVKAFLARYKRRLGIRIHNDGLIEDSYDAAVDTVIATVILVGALIDHAFDVDIDPWVGLGIGSIIIIHAVRLLLRHRKNRVSASAGKADHDS